MSRKKGGVKMGMEMGGSILTPTLFVLKLPVSLARTPGKVAFGSGGRVKILLAWTLVDATMAVYHRPGFKKHQGLRNTH